MDTGSRQDLLGKVGPERRDFLKKIAIAAAFAAPTIATFSVDGMRKKAFAQAAYDPPEVIDLASPNPGVAIVTFNQPMNTGVGDVISKYNPPAPIPSCRTIALGTLSVTGCTWSGTTHQVITFEGFCAPPYVATDTLTVTYNQGACSPRFVGANGLELVPYSGSITVDNPTGC